MEHLSREFDLQDRSKGSVVLSLTLRDEGGAPGDQSASWWQVAGQASGAARDVENADFFTLAYVVSLIVVNG